MARPLLDGGWAERTREKVAASWSQGIGSESPGYMYGSGAMSAYDPPSPQQQQQQYVPESRATTVLRDAVRVNEESCPVVEHPLSVAVGSDARWCWDSLCLEQINGNSLNPTETTGIGVQRRTKET